MKFYGLKNVKAFDQTPDIELAPITIFVGQNSCGKSSLIRFLVLLTQAIRDDAYPIRLHSERINMVDYGNFRDTVHNRVGDEFSLRYAYSYEQFSDVEDRLVDLGLAVFDGMVFETESGEETAIPCMNKVIAEITYAMNTSQNNRDSWIYISSYCLYFDEVQVARLEIDKHMMSCSRIIRCRKCGVLRRNWRS